MESRPALGRDKRLPLTRETKVGVVVGGVHVHEKPPRRHVLRADLEAELETLLALAPVTLDEVVDALLEDALELLDDTLRTVFVDDRDDFRIYMGYRDMRFVSPLYVNI